MKDLESIIAQNDAYYQGSIAFYEGKDRDECPIAPYLGREREMWFRGWDYADSRNPVEPVE